MADVSYDETSKKTTMEATFDVSDVDYEDSTKIKLFIWESLTNLRPIIDVKDQDLWNTLPKGYLYAASCKSETALNPVTVTSDNVKLYDALFGNNVDVCDALYIPAQKKIVLTTDKPSGAFLDTWQVSAKNTLLDLSGNAVPVSSLAEICTTYSDGIDGISILDFSLYDGSKLIVKPEGEKSLYARIRIYNSTDNKKDCMLAIYTDKEEQNKIYEELATVYKNGVTEVELNVPAHEYSQSDGFFVRIK